MTGDPLLSSICLNNYVFLGILSAWELPRRCCAIGLPSAWLGERKRKFWAFPVMLSGLQGSFFLILCPKRQLFSRFLQLSSSAPRAALSQSQERGKPWKLTRCLGHFFDSPPNPPTIVRFSEFSGSCFFYFVQFSVVISGRHSWVALDVSSF